MLSLKSLAELTLTGRPDTPEQPTRFLDALQALPQISILRIKAASSENHKPYTAAPQHLINITELELAREITISTSSFAKADPKLVLPNLQRLTIHEVSNTYKPIMSALRQLPQPIQFQLGVVDAQGLALSELPANVEDLRLVGSTEEDLQGFPCNAFSSLEGCYSAELPLMLDDSCSKPDIQCNAMSRAFGRLQNLRVLHLSDFFTDNAVKVLSPLVFPNLYKLGLKLPCHNARYHNASVFGRSWRNVPAEIAHIPTVKAEELSGTFPALEHIVVHDCGCKVNFYKAAAVQVVQCVWMSQENFPRLRGHL